MTTSANSAKAAAMATLVAAMIQSAGAAYTCPADVPASADNGYSGLKWTYDAAATCDITKLKDRCLNPAMDTVTPSAESATCVEPLYYCRGEEDKCCTKAEDKVSCTKPADTVGYVLTAAAATTSKGNFCTTSVATSWTTGPSRRRQCITGSSGELNVEPAAQVTCAATYGGTVLYTACAAADAAYEISGCHETCAATDGATATDKICGCGSAVCSSGESCLETENACLKACSDTTGTAYNTVIPCKCGTDSVVACSAEKQLCTVTGTAGVCTVSKTCADVTCTDTHYQPGFSTCTTPECKANDLVDLTSAPAYKGCCLLKTCSQVTCTAGKTRISDGAATCAKDTCPDDDTACCVADCTKAPTSLPTLAPTLAEAVTAAPTTSSPTTTPRTQAPSAKAPFTCADSEGSAWLQNTARCPTLTEAEVAQGSKLWSVFPGSATLFGSVSDDFPCFDDCFDSCDKVEQFNAAKNADTSSATTFGEYFSIQCAAIKAIPCLSDCKASEMTPYLKMAYGCDCTFVEAGGGDGISAGLIVAPGLVSLVATVLVGVAHNA